MQNVVLDADRHSVRYLRPGLEINLGSIGGYTDWPLLSFASDMDRAAGLLHGGSSSIYAPLAAPVPNMVGPSVSDIPGRGVAGNSSHSRRAVGTSAATHQHFDYNGRKLDIFSTPDRLAGRGHCRARRPSPPRPPTPMANNRLLHPRDEFT